MALRTHPDKQSAQRSGEGAPSHPSNSSTFTFHVVKAAAEMLLDPLQRRLYDQIRFQSQIRTVGAVSDTYSLAEDFTLVYHVQSSPPTAEDTAMCGRCNCAEERKETLAEVYQMECRCGGTYEVVRFTTSSSSSTVWRSECDCCSLVIEVVA